MAISNLPITVQQLVDLSEPPISLMEKSFRYNFLAIESDQYVCVKDTAPDGSNQVVIVDLHNNNAVTRRPTKKAEAGLMHKRDNIIVLRGRNEEDNTHFIQIFDLNTKVRLFQHQFMDDIVFWKWANENVLAVITTKDVWHCSLNGGGCALKIFDRAGKLEAAETQIINYAVDEAVKWCFLVGISSQDKKTIDGTLQLYSIERQQQQLLEGHTGCFGKLVIEEGKPPVEVFSFVERKNGGYKIHVMDIYSAKGNPPSVKVSANLQFAVETHHDFPIYEHLSSKYGTIFLITRGGYIIIVDALSGTSLFSHKVSSETVFVSCADLRTGGILFVNRKGIVLSATINESTFIPYIQENLSSTDAREITTSLVRRYGYPGADEVLIQSFNNAFARGDYKTASRIAATVKSGALRTAQTISQFKSAPIQPNQVSPILQYFSTLLEFGKLNSLESIELVRPVVAQGRVDFVQKWLAEDKLNCTEELGDIVKPLDEALALQIYEKAEAPNKLMQSYIEQGLYDKVVAFAKKSNTNVDYSVYLRNMLSVNADGAMKFTKELLGNQPPLIDIKQVVEIFTQQHRVQELTSILLDYLKDNSSKDAALQTELFELNLVYSPQVAEAIFQLGTFTHYDRFRIAQLCEKAGLFLRALEHYTDVSDIKRILSMQTTGQINTEWLTNYFGKLAPTVASECLSEMLRANRQNLQVVVQVAIKHNEKIGTMKLIEILQSFGSWEGIFYFLGSILASSHDSDVHFKYIEAAAKLNHLQEVERVCRESQYYDPVKVKDFLKQMKLVDPRPLIYVCDRHGYVAELAEYLYTNSLLKFIEVYVVKVNPSQAATVIGVLLDLDCSEEFIKSLFQNIRGACPAEDLVNEMEKRNRARLLLPWLEARVLDGNQEAVVHNALARIYIDTNRDPEDFLKTNAFYDCKVIGKYCEDRDPHLAYTAYKKSWGKCDQELIQLTNKNGLFRLQARYLVERQSSELWDFVLNSENEFRQQVVEQVVTSALPESTSSDGVSTTVRAFIKAKLPHQLMELLEKIVLHNSMFSQSEEFQNLLLQTAIESDKSRVIPYVNRLDKYNGAMIAALAVEKEMYEEAVTIYKKCSMHDEAMKVIIENTNNIQRAADFALTCDKKSVWATLGNAYLKQKDVNLAITTFLRAQDANAYKEVIALAEKQEAWLELIQYLIMARKLLTVKDVQIENALLYAYAKADRLGEMQEFASGSHNANIKDVGDKLLVEKQYQAAKILFNMIPNYSKVASCHLYLNQYMQAFDAAKKAGSLKTWKEVNLACVDAKEFRYAHMAGLHIIVHPDHLEDLIQRYEQNGYFDELISLLEAGVASEKAPVGLFTELGIVYAKYRPEKLFEFIRNANLTTSGRLNIPKLVRSCEKYQLWSEAICLHKIYKEFDPAMIIMLSHPSAWNHEDFLSIISNVVNTELYYKALHFYIETAPLLINEVLTSIINKVDHARVVELFIERGETALIQPYMEQVQTMQQDVSIVNSSLNNLYLQSESIDQLKKSILEHPNFDQLELAQRMKTHELKELRRISCLIYRVNHKYLDAIDLAKEDGYYYDAIESAKQSGNQEISENLLRYFILEKKDLGCFIACLTMCYNLVRPDVVLELAWRTKCNRAIMPYMIQILREYTDRCNSFEKWINTKENEAAKEKSAPNDYVPEYVVPALGGFNSLALLPSPNVASSGAAATTTIPNKTSWPSVTQSTLTDSASSNTGTSYSNMNQLPNTLFSFM